MAGETTAGEPNTLGGRYRLGERLGRGGMAEVRRAVDTRLERSVAVKQLAPDLATDPSFQMRFRREAQSAGSLNHPNIVAVYDTGEENDPTTQVSIPYIVMELVEGDTLRAVLRSGEKILPERALELTQGVLDALGYSHRAGIIHRDIKPSNVMVTPTGDIKVMDFGIARAIEDTSSNLTQTAAVIGTAQYLSPEQARGETVDARSDIYSAGCLLYELLVGKPPFVGESAVSVAYQHVREAPVPPSQVDPTISGAADAITLKALAKDPADRYQHASEMQADIERVLAGERVAAPLVERPDTSVTQLVPHLSPPPRPSVVAAVPVEEPRRRRKGLAVLVTLLALALLGGGAYGLFRYLQPSGAAAVEMVRVPAVVGQSRSKASSTLAENHLVAQFRNVMGKDDSTLNKVTRQTPLGGNAVAANSTVVLEVNVGPDSAVIPVGLTGEDVDQAKRELEDAGFSDVNTQKAKSEPAGAAKDAVLSVYPGEGETLPLKEKITLVFATGKKHAPSAEQTGNSSSSKPTQTTSTQPTSTQPTSSPSKSEPSKSEPSKSEPSKSTRSPTSKLDPTSDPTTSGQPTGSRTPTSTNQPTASEKPTTSKQPSPTITSTTPEPSASDTQTPSTNQLGSADPGTASGDPLNGDLSNAGSSSSADARPASGQSPAPDKP